MPVRIYSLAKELKLDSKVLVDICTAAGVTGKGSALASLTDEEADRVKAYMAGGASAKGGKSRPTASATIDAAETGVVRREDYIAPTGTAEKVPVLADRSKAKKKPTNGETPAKAPPPKPGATIKLAPMPTVPEPAAPPPDEVGAEARPAAADRRHQGSQPRRHQAADRPRSQTAGQTPRGRARRRAAGPARAARGERPAARGKPAAGSPLPAGGPLTRRGRGGVHPTKGQGEEPGLLVGREQRQLNRRRAGNDNRQRTDEEEAATPRRRSSSRVIKRTGTNTAAPRKGRITLELPCTVRSFSEAVGVSASQVLRQLLGLGTLANANINSEIDAEMAELAGRGAWASKSTSSTRSTWPKKSSPPCETSPTTPRCSSIARR